MRNISIESYKGLPRDVLVYQLSKRQDLSDYEKDIIITRLYPDNVPHMGLPDIIMSNRKLYNHPEGYLSDNIREQLILLRAYSCVQYHRFMRHLLHSFIEKPNIVYINKEDNEDCECIICRKKLSMWKKWEPWAMQNPSFGEQHRREFLAYSSEESNFKICIDCIIQLRGLDSILRETDGISYLDNYVWKF